MSEDLAHDAHLRAALRHAPDHALSPPAGVSQAILAAARHAHQAPRTADAPPPPRMRLAGSRPLAVWWRRVTSPRWAGALATGLVAALGLGLWLDLATEPVVERSTGPASHGAPAASPVAETPRSVPPAPVTAADARDPTGEAPVTATAPRAAAKEATPEAPRRSEGATAREGDVAATAQSKREPDRPQQQRAEGGRTDEAPTHQAEGRSSADADGSMRSKAPSSDMAAPIALPAPAIAKAQATGAASDTRDAAAPASALSAAPPPATNRLRAAAPPQGARRAETVEALAAASPALALLQRARADASAGGASWTWSAPGSLAIAPFDDVAQAWLQRVTQAARGRWNDVGDRGEALDAIEVRWWRDGWPRATLRIEADGLRWIEADGRIRYAALDAVTLQRLRSF